MNLNERCLSCGSSKVDEVLFIRNVPAHCCILWDAKKKALECPKGDIKLNFCNDCGHLYNQLFNNDLMSYSQDYDNTLHFSKVFQEYSMELVKRLTDTYQLYEKDIIEIGCGKGDFLKMICSYGENRGYGFDKSYQPELDSTAEFDSIKFIQDYYSEKYSNYPADVIISRFVLEHIQDPANFINDIKKYSKKDNEIIYYFEVPNILYTLRDNGIWDLIYEHCSHFNVLSLSNLFQRLNFSVLNAYESYSGQYLSIEASTYQKHSSDFSNPINIETLKDLVSKFKISFEEKISHWSTKLVELKNANRKVVVWGGGAKGVSFLNYLDTVGIIDEIVDINPRKLNKYIPGSGQKYISPEELLKINPDVIIIMNPVYETEITKTLEEMNIKSDIMLA